MSIHAVNPVYIVALTVYDITYIKLVLFKLFDELFIIYHVVITSQVSVNKVLYCFAKVLTEFLNNSPS